MGLLREEPAEPSYCRTSTQSRTWQGSAKTGRPYRVYHAIPVHSGQLTLFHWIDINEAPRKAIHKSLINRREQMVGDGLQLTLDAAYWNGLHPDEEPIELPMDLTPDIEWRMNAP